MAAAGSYFVTGVHRTVCGMHSSAFSGQQDRVA
jgi:hypothetical protein